MKLFTTNEVKTNQQHEFLKNLSRAETVNQVLQDKRTELDKVEAEFNAVLENQRRQWQAEQTEHLEKISNLRNEVEKLEKRRKSALTPVELRKEELEKISKIIDKKQQKLKTDQEDFDDKVEKLEERLTIVAEQELEVKRIINTQKSKQKGLDLQREQVAEQSKQLAEELKKALTDNTTKKQELIRLETKLNLKEKGLKDKELELIKIEQSFVDRERALQDKYATLERTAKHLNIKL